MKTILAMDILDKTFKDKEIIEEVCINCKYSYFHEDVIDEEHAQGNCQKTEDMVLKNSSCNLFE